MRCLYKTLLSLEIKPVLLTGGIEAFRDSRTINLMEAGYSNWQKLILRAIPYNNTKFNAWTAEGKAPAIPSMLGVYETVLSLGIKPVFITGTRENFKQVRITNLNKAGYSNWAALILKGENDSGSAVQFKSSKRTDLVKAGYRIVGNIGDQWTDLIGENVGARTFKVPDPMYYIG